MGEVQENKEYMVGRREGFICLRVAITVLLSFLQVCDPPPTSFVNSVR